MTKFKAHTPLLFSGIIASLLVSPFAAAQPYGQGLYNENVPYGDQTSLSIATDGNISIPVTPSSGGTLATANSQVTVTSTDVRGYKLYLRALNSSDMDNLGSVISSSSNAIPNALAVNTWGYNTNASNNFLGIDTDDLLLTSVSVPTPAGDVTTVTYGVNIDLSKPAGNYTASVLYTAVPQTD